MAAITSGRANVAASTSQRHVAPAPHHNNIAGAGCRFVGSGTTASAAAGCGFCTPGIGPVISAASRGGSLALKLLYPKWSNGGRTSASCPPADRGAELAEPAIVHPATPLVWIGSSPGTYGAVAEEEGLPAGRAEALVVLAFLTVIVAVIVLVVVYWRGGQVQLEGALLALALG